MKSIARYSKRLLPTWLVVSIAMIWACSNGQINVTDKRWEQDGRNGRVEFTIENLTHGDIDVCILVDLSLKNRSSGARRSGTISGHPIEIPVHLDPEQSKSISHELVVPGLGSISNMKVVQVKCTK